MSAVIGGQQAQRTAAQTFDNNLLAQETARLSSHWLAAANPTQPTLYHFQLQRLQQKQRGLGSSLFLKTDDTCYPSNTVCSQQVSRTLLSRAPNAP